MVVLSGVSRSELGEGSPMSEVVVVVSGDSKSELGEGSPISDQDNEG